MSDTTSPSDTSSTRFLLYKPPDGSSPVQTEVCDPQPSQKRGRPKGSSVAQKYLSEMGDTVQKRPVGRPKGTGYKQKAQRATEKKNLANPPPYAPIGLVVPGTGPNPSTWDAIMQSRTSNANETSQHPKDSEPLPSNTHNSSILSSYATQTAPNADSSDSSHILYLPDSHQSSTVIEQSPTHPAIISSHNSVVERAQRVASSVNVESTTEPSQPPRSPNIESESLLHLVDLDEDELLENCVDSLIAEGIGEDDMSEDENDDENSEIETREEGLDSSAQEQKSKRVSHPYPSWFQLHLNKALTQIRADRSGLSSHSRLYASGTFWFPTTSVWSILHKPDVRPSDLFVPQFFLWDPDDLIELKRQYLHTVVSRLNLPGQSYEPFLPFKDTSDKGFHGFVPSGQWLRNVYDDFIESHKHDFHQHTAMLTGDICAIDHSHKLVKHIAKVDGVPIFTALLTVTNDKGEIRVCNFVATKSHSQFTDALKRMRESLDLYGHKQPEVFYTDNMSDKAMLEECFPSLLKDIVPVERHSNLPAFTLPADIIHVLSTTEEIDNTLRAVMEHLPTSGGYLAVGFDAEWNVDIGEDGRVRGREPTAVLQIALKNEVYILQIGEQLLLRRLPHQLVVFLQEPRILKAGRMVNADLHHLETVSGQGPFVGGLELGAFAKERFLISDARSSLSDLTAEILGKCLPKSNTDPAQRDYAAKDAYASLMLYHTINKIPLPEKITRSTPIDTPVIVLSDDQKKIIAHGVLSSSEDHFLDGVHITSTCAVVHVHKVIIPGAILKLHSRSLNDLGQPPFDIVSHQSRL
ncbi:hypothetical protein GYMLUDRAFT_248378 [Collybiopsis luxurians FD-317 M1]|uniref:Uncharacterized protein n=1 Tax=Collybiopsis luxurians FD-317 M1 TaxID=944289 RepID=A0A0D0CKV0_9AGAR|nr:hypothetical protein GYMLUDRAFT_248378 [Collybiopsis luxurians FD-317 M1]